MDVSSVLSAIYQFIGTENPRGFIVFSCVVGALVGGLVACKLVLNAEKENAKPVFSVSGGSGGSVDVAGSNNVAIGGAGGNAGVGNGGNGGSVSFSGENIRAWGGDGGNAAQRDGRGGRRAKSAAEIAGAPTYIWNRGYGGAGVNDPEYDRRLHVLSTLRAEYSTAFPDDQKFIDAGIEQVPTNWINARLAEIGETWRVGTEMSAEGGYQMPPL